MDALIAEHEKLVKGASLAKGIQDVQKTIDLLTNARDVIQRSAYHSAAFNIPNSLTLNDRS